MGGLFSGRSAEVEHERLAAVILDGMYQFVALLNPRGDILEVNRAALEGAGHKIEEIRGKPFWTARWWQVSEEIQEQLKAAIRLAASGEFVRYEVQAYGDDAGLSEITTDFSLRPIRGESGEVEYLLPEGRNITERKQAENEVARQAEELRVLNERLKELDRLKTQFFANVSHEFRTPLTLMLGPLENALATIDAQKHPEVAADLATSHRNALRLLKLVNTMLDFSRIEAGRVQASYQSTDIAAFTTELASVFRSACEKAGLRLIVDCAPFNNGEQAYLDRDMWEKIVLNLLSNAYKFTLEGEIEVRLVAIEGHAQLTVRDTGVGIRREELPRMFERFHRIDHTRGRTHEGTGIGLALVHELVKLHGGTVSVDSKFGEGSIFTVSIPLGKAHLDPGSIGRSMELRSTGIAPAAYIEEALRWLPDESTLITGPHHTVSGDESACANERTQEEKSAEAKPRILWADDNADMRNYVSRLMAGRYDVEAVCDGESALKAARAHPPNLVLSDVMMPNVDGFGLLRGLRDDPQLREIPVILLSARAGEESRVEGLEAGADDYLVKPFTARELLARVGAHLKLAQARKDAEARLRENEARFRALVTATSDVIYRMSPHWRQMAQLHGKDFLADTTDASTTWLEKYIPPEDQADVLKAIREAVEAQQPFKLEHRVLRADGTLGWTISRAIPMMDENGNVVEWFGAASDVTAAKQAQESLRQSHAKLSEQAHLLDLSNDAILVRDQDDRVIYWNRGATEIYGYTSEEAAGQVTHELLRTEFPEPLSRIQERLSCDGRWSGELVHTRKDGGKIFVGSRWALERDVNGKTVRVLETNSDTTQRKQAEDALRRSEKLAVLGRMAATISHEINNPLEALSNLLYLASTTEGLPSSARQRLADADAELQRVAHITRQSLGFYRESNAAGSVGVNTLIESVISLLRNRIEARHVCIEKQWRSAQEIRAVAGELRQVFSNLLMNCLDAVDEGGTVKVRAGWCTIGDDRPGIRITFSDNGKGIEAAMRSRIFEPLYTTKGSVGTGLGLWVSKQIVEKHKGRIQMRSSTAGNRRGSTFSILLPR